MKNQLIVTPPPLTTFTGYADPLAILCSFDEGQDWVYSHYIKIQVNDIVNRKNNPDNLMEFAPFTSSFFNDFDTRKQANVVADNIFLGGERCPFFNVFEIPNDYVNAIDGAFVDFIKRTIDGLIYLYAYLDISKIPVYRTTEPLGHQLLIYGYDDDTRTINFADFVDNRRYTFTTCSYDEIEAAYKGISKLFLPIVKSVALVQHIGYGAYTFDMSYVQDSVHEYLSPDQKVTERQNNYTMSIFAPVSWQTETYMGVDVYGYFAKFIAQEFELGKTYIDERLFHAMYDHKEMMIKRMEHFLKKGYLSVGMRSLHERYKTEVKDRMQSVRNSVVKHNMSGRTDSLDYVRKLLPEIRETESELLRKIFEV
jgi:hypothetical protein